jgi:hypothetical protein
MAFRPITPLQIVRSELQGLLTEKANIEQKIEAVQQTIKILEAVYVDDPEAVPISLADLLNVGLTDRVRMVFRTTTKLAVSPTEIRDAVVSGGFDFGSSPNPMAAIHTIIKRLKESGEITEIPTSEGKKYRGIGTLERKKIPYGGTGFVKKSALEPVPDPDAMEPRPIGRQGNIRPPAGKGPRDK